MLSDDSKVGVRNPDLRSLPKGNVIHGVYRRGKPKKLSCAFRAVPVPDSRSSSSDSASSRHAFEPGSQVVNEPPVMTVRRESFSIRFASPRPCESGWLNVASSSAVSPVSKSASRRLPSRNTSRSRIATRPCATARPASASYSIRSEVTVRTGVRSTTSPSTTDTPSSRSEAELPAMVAVSRSADGGGGSVDGAHSVQSPARDA